MGPVRLIACCCRTGQGRGLLLPAMHGGICIDAEADALGDLHPCRGCWHHPSQKIVSMIWYSRDVLQIVAHPLDDSLRHKLCD